MSVALLAGIIRVIFWFIAFAACVYYKRVVGAILFATVVTSSGVFLFSNAGIDVPFWAFEYAVVVSTPIAAVFAVATIAALRERPSRDRWSMW